MRAAVYYETGGPEVFRHEDVPDPELTPSGVLVEMGAVGIQGGDLLHRQGGVMASTPHVVGYQAAGTIVAVGESVTNLTEGQKVVATMGFGSHASLLSVPAAACYAVPDELSVEEAAGIPIEFGTAHDCLFEFGDLEAGEMVLIQAGAGGVGLVVDPVGGPDRAGRHRHHLPAGRSHPGPSIHREPSGLRSGAAGPR